MFRALACCLLITGSGVFASELVSSRITVPLPQLMKYADAAAACEAEGMQLARFNAEEAIEYTTATLVQKNLDRVWIGAMGADERAQLALEVFEGVPIVYKVEQIADADKMLAVLCEPKSTAVESEMKSESDLVSIEESIKDLNLVQAEEEAVTPIMISSVTIATTDVTEDTKDAATEVVICTFEVDNETESVVQIESQNQEDDGIDLIKSKGTKGCGRSRRSSRCSRSSSECRRSRSSSSSSSEECGRRQRRRNRGYRRKNRGYRRRNNNCSRSSSSSTSSTCASSFSCDPFCPTGSSSSSTSESRFNRRSRNNRQNRRSSRNNGRSSRNCRSSSSSSPSSSSSEDCGTGRCGLGRTSRKFFREIRLSQRIH